MCEFAKVYRTRLKFYKSRTYYLLGTATALSI